MEKTIKNWLLAHEEEFIQDLFTLVRINSVRGETKEGLPFGEGPKEALDAGLKICERYGFHTKNWDNYVGTADFSPELSRLSRTASFTEEESVTIRDRYLRRCMLCVP